MRKVGMLLCGLVFVGGMLLLVFLAPSLFSPFAWGWGAGPFAWGTGPWLWGGFGFPIIGLGMFVLCVLMMGGMMLHGGPLAHGMKSQFMGPQGETNLDILERRYSRGEITQEQLETMKRDLGL